MDNSTTSRRYIAGAFEASYSILGLAVSFRSPDRNVATMVERAFGAARQETVTRSALHVVIAPPEARTGHYIVSTEPPNAFPESRLAAAVFIQTLVSMVNQWCLDHCEGILVFHAGAVVRDGRGLLLPAASGSGKSTLTTYLVLYSSYEFLSDEAGVLEIRSGKLLPFARSIGLKPASFPVLGLGERPAELHARKRSDFVSIARLGLKVAAPAPPRLILVPRFVPGGLTEVERLSPQEAAGHLLAQAHVGPAGTAGLDTLLRLAREVPSYRMTFGRLEPADEALDSLWLRHRESE